MKEKDKAVVMFPNLGGRLREKGFLALHNKQFSEALVCFEQLAAYELADEQSEFAAVVCLMELQDVEAARQRCEALLQDSDALFFEVLEMYVTILLQLHDYATLTETVQLVLEQREMSDGQREKLYPLLSFSEKMEDVHTEQLVDEDVLAALAGDHLANQLQALYKLRQQGRMDDITVLEQFLQDDTKHPYVKTAMLELLMDWGVREPVTVAKFGRVVTVVPRDLPNVQEAPIMMDVLELMEQGAGGQNPTMQQALSAYWQEMQQLLFPLPLIPEDASVWAAALEKMGSERFMLFADEEQIANDYNISVEKLRMAYEWLLYVEQEGFLPL